MLSLFKSVRLRGANMYKGTQEARAQIMSVGVFSVRRNELIVALLSSLRSYYVEYTH